MAEKFFVLFGSFLSPSEFQAFVMKFYATSPTAPLRIFWFFQIATSAMDGVRSFVGEPLPITGVPHPPIHHPFQPFLREHLAQMGAAQPPPAVDYSFKPVFADPSQVYAPALPSTTQSYEPQQQTPEASYPTTTEHLSGASANQQQVDSSFNAAEPVSEEQNQQQSVEQTFETSSNSAENVSNQINQAAGQQQQLPTPGVAGNRPRPVLMDPRAMISRTERKRRRRDFLKRLVAVTTEVLKRISDTHLSNLLLNSESDIYMDQAVSTLIRTVANQGDPDRKPLMDINEDVDVVPVMAILGGDSNSTGGIQVKTEDGMEQIGMQQTEVQAIPVQVPQHHPSAGQKHMVLCSGCAKIFSSTATLAQHVCTHTITESGDEASSAGPKIPFPPPGSNEIKPFQCEFCDKNFGSRASLNAHLITHNSEKKDFQCKTCGKFASSKAALVKHHRVHTGEKPFVCESCPAAFADQSALKVHRRTHTGEKPYQCVYCPSSFSTNQMRKVHERRHTGEKPFPCNTCGKCFPSQNAVYKHQAIHSGERPYVCERCSKAFLHKTSLKIHERTHTGERPYRCSFCPKAFAQVNTLHVHLRSHTGEKPYQCDFCAMAFSSGSARWVHMRTHTDEKPFECNVCGKRARTKADLRVHTRIHTGERPYQCKTCSKFFISTSRLICHERIHSGDRPYICQYCSKSFTESSHLKRHLKTHQGHQG